MVVTVETLKAIFVADITKFQTSVTKAMTVMNRTADGMISAGKRLSLGITLPLAAIGVAAVKSAADVEIIENKFRTVFRSSAAEATLFSQTLAKTTGRSEFALRGLLAGVQDTLVPLGLARERASDLSQDIVKLAADVASFNNVQDEQVVQAFTRALTGEFESLKQFGIVINQASLDQELMNMGILGGVKAATQAQKAFAIYNLILAGSTDAQGKAAELAGTLDGRLLALRNRISDVKTRLGQDLLPLAEKVVSVFEETVNALDALNPAQKQLAIILGLVAGAIGPVVLGLGLMVKTLGLMVKTVNLLTGSIIRLIAVAFSPVALIIVALAALITQVVFAFNLLDQILNKVGTSLREVIDTAVSFWKRKISEWLAALRPLLETLASIVPENFAQRIREALGTIAPAASEAAGVAKDLFAGAAEGTKNDFSSAWEFISNKAKDTFGTTLESFGFDLKELERIMKGLGKPGIPSPVSDKAKDDMKEFLALVEKFKGTGVSISPKKFPLPFQEADVNKLIEGVTAAIEIIETGFERDIDGAIKKIAGTSKETFTQILTILNKVKEGSLSVAEAQREIARTVHGPVRGSIMAVGLAVKASIDEFTNFHSVVERVADTIVDGFLGLGDAITDFITGTKSAKEAFRDFAREFLTNIVRMINQLISLEIAKTILGKLKIPGFAKGGQLGTGKVGVVGEAGPELISGPASVTPIRAGMFSPVNIMIEQGPGTEVVPQVDVFGNLKMMVKNTIVEELQSGKANQTARNTFRGLRNVTVAGG